MVKLLGKVLLTAVLLLTSSLALAVTVNINTADAERIAKHVKGIGPKKADAIVAYRKANGPFKSVQDLTKVKGIGPKVLEKNKDIIVITGTQNSKTDLNRVTKSP